jgi:hypothetical protein
MVVCSAQWHSFSGFRMFFRCTNFISLRFKTKKKSSVLQSVRIQMVAPSIAGIYICDHNLLSSCILGGYAWSIYRHSSACQIVRYLGPRNNLSKDSSARSEHSVGFSIPSLIGR